MQKDIREKQLEEWSGPKTLLDMLNLREREFLKPFLLDYKIMEENVLKHEKEDNGMVTIGEALVNRGIERDIERGVQALILDNRNRDESEEDIIINLQKRFHLSKEDATKYTERF